MHLWSYKLNYITSISQCALDVFTEDEKDKYYADLQSVNMTTNQRKIKSTRGMSSETEWKKSQNQWNSMLQTYD